MKHLAHLKSRSWLCAAAGLLTILVVTTGSTPVLAQAADAADRCTPDVMRLCNEFIPDADKIVVCLKRKRHQLSASCASALAPAGKSKRHRVHHRAT